MTSTHSSAEKQGWVVRWKYEMTAKALRPGIWALKDGGYFLRTRLLDPRSGKFVEYRRVLRDVTLNQAERERYRLRCDARDLASGRKQAPMLWSTYAASLFESKTNEGKIQSAKGREKWATTLRRLIPAFGHFYVDELRLAHLIAWRNEVARWIKHGMPSIRKRDAGKRVLVKLSPATANGWISILRVICRAMTKHFELARDPSDGVEYFSVPRTYTREEPNALTTQQSAAFVARMKALYPQHYAMVHETERMQAHYSTAQRDEMLIAVSRVAGALVPEQG